MVLIARQFGYWLRILDELDAAVTAKRGTLTPPEW